MCNLPCAQALRRRWCGRLRGRLAPPPRSDPSRHLLGARRLPARTDPPLPRRQIRLRAVRGGPLLPLLLLLLLLRRRSRRLLRPPNIHLSPQCATWLAHNETTWLDHSESTAWQVTANLLNTVATVVAVLWKEARRGRSRAGVQDSKRKGLPLPYRVCGQELWLLMVSL